MPNNLVIYMVAHQPRRVRLPALLIPRGTAPEKMDALIFDDQMDRRYFDKVSKYCYRPATELFQSLVDKGMKISLGFSFRSEDGCPDLRRPDGPPLLRQGFEVLLPAGHRALPVARGQGDEDLPRLLGLVPAPDATFRSRRAGRLPEARQPRERRADRGRALSLLHLLSRYRRLCGAHGVGQAATRGDLPENDRRHRHHRDVHVQRRLLPVTAERFSGGRHGWQALGDGLARTDAPLPLSQRGDAALYPPLRAE